MGRVRPGMTWNWDSSLGWWMMAHDGGISERPYVRMFAVYMSKINKGAR